MSRYGTADPETAVMLWTAGDEWSEPARSGRHAGAPARAFRETIEP